MLSVDPQEVELRDGELILRFDGGVLEIFAKGQDLGLGQQYENSMRINVKQLLVRTEGPDRKQRYKVVFAGPACGWPLKLEEAEWLDLQPLLETLRRSGVELSQD